MAELFLYLLGFGRNWDGFGKDNGRMFDDWLVEIILIASILGNESNEGAY
jgi:hypothetical protein